MMDKFHEQCEATLHEAKSAFMLTRLEWDGPPDSPLIDAAYAQVQAVEKAVADLTKAHEEHLRELMG